MNVTRYVVLVYSLACKRRRVIQEVGRQPIHGHLWSGLFLERRDYERGGVSGVPWRRFAKQCWPSL